MNIPAPVGSDEKFTAYLKVVGLHPDVYRALEFIFRQAMMHVSDGKFTYVGEKRIPWMFRPGKGAKIGAIAEEIFAWERRHAPPDYPRELRYGFAALRVDEIAADQALIEKFDQALASVEELGGDSLRNEILALKSGLRDSGRFHDKVGSKYVSSVGSDGAMKLQPGQWGYFRTYFIMTKLIFGPVLPPEKLTGFISTKVVREHFELAWIGDEFTPKKIGNRMRRSGVAEKRLASELHDSGLVGGDVAAFVQFLRNNAHQLAKDSTAA